MLLDVNKLPYIIGIFTFVTNYLVFVGILHSKLIHRAIFDLFKINCTLYPVLGIIVFGLKFAKLRLQS